MSQSNDSLERPRRFYKEAARGPMEGGFAVLLDGRAVRSPSRARLILPNEALAALIAREWAGQGEYIEMGRMPATRLAYTAIDWIGDKREQTIEEVVRYAGSDLLCYRAGSPRGLVARQIAAWDPMLAWARQELQLTFHIVEGIIHKPQPQETLDRITDLAGKLDTFGLAGLAYATALYGSAVLALGVLTGRLGGDEAFELSRVDEAYQQEQWGVDYEAADRTAQHRADAAMVGEWFEALRG
ncbi:MAG: ATP12 family protein [Caulobacteraceae bacterium]|nr:ATP12 family protein [Caulobacteraceae bacterium]